MYVSLSEAKEWVKAEESIEIEYDTIQSLLDAAEAAVNTYCLKTFDTDDVPNEVLLAVRLYVGYFYDNRSAGDPNSLSAMERAFNALLHPLRDKAKLF